MSFYSHPYGYQPTNMSRQRSDSSGGSYESWENPDDVAYNQSSMEYTYYTQGADGSSYYPENDYTDYTSYTTGGSDETTQYYENEVYYYEEDQEQQQPSSSPSTSKSGKKSSRDKKTGYPCLGAGCSAKPFARHADLERHIKHCHLPDSQKDSFPCDYKKCERKSRPFHRRDHQRDHYRDYHNEDLSKRSNGSSSGAISAKAIVKPNWFRCSKCLVRVDIQENGFRCGACRTECSDERKTLRGYVLQEQGY